MERMDGLNTEQDGRTAAVLSEKYTLENANEIQAFLEAEKERIKLERQKVAERQEQIEYAIRSLKNMEDMLSVLTDKELPSALKKIATANYR